MKQLLTLAIVAISWAGLACADPASWQAEGWAKTDFAKTSIKFDEIISGGPPKDGIPSIDAPQFIAVEEAKNLAPAEAVVGFEHAGDARAYPLRVMIWHEIVNDTVGGKPVTVTYCPLCNSAIVFSRSLNGEVLDFGTTGKLRNSDLVMYDRQSESWWQQFTGEAIVGARLGQKLEMLPARLESFSEFAARFPKGRVLVPLNPSARDYGRNPYEGYDTSAAPFLYRGEMPEGIEPMARVVVARPQNSKPVIVAMEAIRGKGSIEEQGLVFSWREGQASALDAGDITKGRTVGSITVADKSGNAVVHDVTFAFVAHAFHPDVLILK